MCTHNNGLFVTTQASLGRKEQGGQRTMTKFYNLLTSTVREARARFGIITAFLNTSVSVIHLEIQSSLLSQGTNF